MTYFLIEQRRHANLIFLDSLEIDTLLRTHRCPPTAQPPTIHSCEELAQHPGLADRLLHHMVLAAELQLVPKIWQPPRVHELLHRVVLVQDSEVRRRHAEDVRDEIRVELGRAVDDRSAPVVAAEDDMGGFDRFGEVGDEVCVVLEGVVVEIL